MSHHVRGHRPPFGAWLLYRLLGWRVPRRYLPWVEHDVARRGWPLRLLAGRALVVLLLFGAWSAGVYLLTERFPYPMLAGLGFGLGIATFILRGDRERFLEYQRGVRPSPDAPRDQRVTLPVVVVLVAAVAACGVIVLYALR